MVTIDERNSYRFIETRSQICGPWRNRTAVSAMRMQCITSVRTAQVSLVYPHFGEERRLLQYTQRTNSCGTFINLKV